MLDMEEYNTIKKELLRRKTYPYYFFNEGFKAKEFYKKFREEVPTARLYCFAGTKIERPFQAVTHDQRAEKRLWEQIEYREIKISDTVISLMDLRNLIEKSIQSGDTRLIKQKKRS